MRVRFPLSASGGPFRLVVRTSLFQGGNTGSIPVRDNIILKLWTLWFRSTLLVERKPSVFIIGMSLNIIKNHGRGRIVPMVERRFPKPQVRGSSPFSPGVKDSILKNLTTYIFQGLLLY